MEKLVSRNATLIELLRLSWQEHGRTDAILEAVLPFLRHRHLLASDYEAKDDLVSSEAREKINKEFSRLVSLAQGLTVQFNESPFVSHLDELAW